MAVVSGSTMAGGGDVGGGQGGVGGGGDVWCSTRKI